MPETSQNADQWTDCRVVITGASSGIGRATSLELARMGCRDFILHYRQNESGIRKTTALIEEINAEIHTQTIAADLSLSGDRSKLVDTAFETQSVDVWINNAGADVLTGQAAEMTFEQKLEHLWKVDVEGTIDLSRLVAARMKAANHRVLPKSMVFIGWDQAPHGMEGDAGQMFGPIKAAVMAFAHSMAQEHAPEIRVNCVAPGWIQTAWGETTQGYWDRRACQQALMNRWGSVDDVARAIAFAADPKNTFLAGQTININGGFSRRYDDLGRQGAANQ